MGIRASGKIDVSVMARKLFGGGGHPNAAGGRMQGGIRDGFVYENVKAQVVDWINSREG